MQVGEAVGLERHLVHVPDEAVDVEAAPGRRAQPGVVGGLDDREVELLVGLLPPLGVGPGPRLLAQEVEVGVVAGGGLDRDLCAGLEEQAQGFIASVVEEVLEAVALALRDVIEEECVALAPLLETFGWGSDPGLLHGCATGRRGELL